MIMKWFNCPYYQFPFNKLPKKEKWKLQSVFIACLNLKTRGNIPFSDLKNQNEFKSKFKVYSFRDGVGKNGSKSYLLLSE